MKKIISIVTSALLVLMYLIPASVLGIVSAEDNENTAPTRIEFCEMSFILDYEQYSGIYLDSNRDVYSFLIENDTEDWNLYSYPGETPIKLTDPMPQGGLLDYLSEHQECCKLIGKTSLEDYEDYKNELEQIDLNAEMEYRLFDEPDVIGLGHVERFAIRYDDSGSRKIVFLSGGLSAENDLYLENPDLHAVALNDKMIQYEKIEEPATTEVTTSVTTTATVPTTTTTNSTISSTSTSNTSTTTTETATVTATIPHVEDAYFELEAEIVHLPNVTAYNWYNDRLSLDGLTINLWLVEENGHKQTILQNQPLSDLPEEYSYDVRGAAFDNFGTNTINIIISTNNEILDTRPSTFIQFDVEYVYTPVTTNSETTNVTTITTTIVTISQGSETTTTREPRVVPQFQNDKKIAFVYNDFSLGTETKNPTYTYSGFYITMNGDMYSFNVNSIDNLTYCTYNTFLTNDDTDFSQSIPQRRMLNVLNDLDDLVNNKKIGSVEKSELNYYLALQDKVDISASVDITYRSEDDILPYSETWGVRQSDNNVVFFNGRSDIYLTHTDENANIIDEWLRNLEFESTTTTFKNITQNDFINWAITDYESKTGITPSSADFIENADGNYEITLTDENGTILDIYTVDPATADGTNQLGEEVNLPQTGYSDIYKVIAGLAALMTVSGATIVVKTKKETE